MSNEGIRIILASKSPRRQQILKEMGFEFDVINLDVDESFAGVEAEKVAAYLSKKKSLAYGPLGKNEILITADTTVLSEGEILNKPADSQEAFSMLQKLSGKSHWVITGVTIRTYENLETFDENTEVYVRQLPEKDILYYIENFKPYDKAGAYGIQEWFGHTQISRIEGSFTNVMGLPSQKLFQKLTGEIARINQINLLQH
jgi:septum formation protein